MKVSRGVVALVFSFLLVPRVFSADAPKKDEASLPPAIAKITPDSLDDLKAIQTQTKKVLDKVIPCTVGVQVGEASGSGVIVSKDGFVLTAGHVSGKPGQKCTVILPDGKRLAAKSLGRDEEVDSGMFKITESGEWPFAEMGKSSDLKAGQWCIAVGHPNGYQRGRSPVVRLGRIHYAGKCKTKSDCVLTTDCILVGGDSGGPLFDMEAKVIGIHSRIGSSTNSNTHVPIDAYSTAWNKLVRSQEIDGKKAPIKAYLGVQVADEAKDCKLGLVTQDSPADRGGLKAGDIILKFDGKEVKDYDDLLEILGEKKPGDDVEVVVKRGMDNKSLKVKLDKRG